MISITVSFSRSISCSLLVNSIILENGNAVALSVSRLTQESKSITFWKGCMFETHFFFFFFFFVVFFCCCFFCFVLFVVVVVCLFCCFFCFFFLFFLSFRFALTFSFFVLYL